MRVGVLWKYENLGVYANRDFNFLYTAVGNNTGNLAFVYAVKSTISNPMKFFGWSTKPEILKNECDIIVIPCANQLGRHMDLGGVADIIAEADLPVVAIGLGAQADSFDVDVELNEGTKRWVNQLDKHRLTSSPNIYTRGPYTASQLRNIGVEDAVVGGCPSYFINTDRELGSKISSRWNQVGLPRRISVCAGHQAWVKRVDLEHQLVSLVHDDIYQGQYVVQSMREMIAISRDAFDLLSEKEMDMVRNYILPHYSTEEFKRWCQKYAVSFYDVPAWMDSLRKFDLTIGSRYHGVALGIQAGLMGVVIAIDSRTEELCMQTSIPYIKASDIKKPLTRKNIKEMWMDFDGEGYDRQRAASAADYVRFLESNGLTPATSLKSLL